jgi:nucleoid-associated protein YgaU
MGLFDFVKEAGRKLGIGGDAPTPDELRAEVTKLGLDAKDLAVDVQGDVVKVSGNAPSQEQREKIVLAMGNVHGVSKVEDNITVAAAGSSAPSGSSAGESKFYTVKSGDTLSKVSKEFYGDRTATTRFSRPTSPCLSTRTRSIRGRSCAFPDPAQYRPFRIPGAGKYLLQ